MVNRVASDYYFALEDDLIALSRYIEFDKDNFDVFSFELSRLLICIGSEVDINLKCLCNALGDKKSYENMTEYRELLTHPDRWIGRGDLGPFERKGVWDSDIYIGAPQYGMGFQPWADFSVGKSPFWWKAYNLIKHSRYEHCKDASLKNVLYAFAGLYYIVKKLMDVLPFDGYASSYPYRNIDSMFGVNRHSCE